MADTIAASPFCVYFETSCFAFLPKLCYAFHNEKCKYWKQIQKHRDHGY